jgi:hypothetical protein
MYMHERYEIFYIFFGLHDHVVSRDYLTYGYLHAYHTIIFEDCSSHLRRFSRKKIFECFTSSKIISKSIFKSSNLRRRKKKRNFAFILHLHKKSLKIEIFIRPVNIFSINTYISNTYRCTIVTIVTLFAMEYGKCQFCFLGKCKKKSGGKS